MELFQTSNLTLAPFIKINNWIHEAVQKGVDLPHAMNLATVDSSGQPSSRMVLLKAISDKSLIFYTDYSSKKGVEIKNNLKAALNFWWVQTNKQIRIEGTCSKTTLEESDAYFSSRPRRSQISAHVSKQSLLLKDYDSLLKKAKEFEEKNLGKEIRRPKNWGGYVLEPKKIEFWMNKSNRLHHREIFSLSPKGWNRSILYP